MTRKKVLIGGGIVIVAVAAVAASFYFKKDKGVLVAAEAIKRHDLEGIVSASGKIQPKRLVNISADTPGRVVFYVMPGLEPVSSFAPFAAGRSRSVNWTFSAQCR